MEKVAPNSKFVGYSTEIIRQSKNKGPLTHLILPGVMVRLRTGDGDVRDNELRRPPIPLCCWAKVKELRRGARGVAVGVVEAEDTTEFLRLLPLMGEETMDLVIMLHRGDMATWKI